MKVIRDIWLCQDCLFAAVNDDYTGLDYHYGEPEASRRESEIRVGLAALPGLVPDWNEEAEFECRDCGYIGTEDMFDSADDGDDEYGDSLVCRKCGSEDTIWRDTGERDFSRMQCDCCGSHLAGSRHRFAQLVPDTVREGP